MQEDVSPTVMPVLSTGRLVIRPFEEEDLPAVHRILDLELNEGWSQVERRRYIDWRILSYAHLGALYQPPYGERAIVRQADDEIVGVCGLVPSMGPFGLLPSFSEVPIEDRHLSFPEVGLYYALAPKEQGKGYATEAARALIDYGFSAWNLHRIVATTTRDNARSMSVMRRLGMKVERNPEPEPEWFQVIGVLPNPALGGPVFTVHKPPK